MAANLEDQLIDKVRALPPDKQQEALRLLDTLTTAAGSEETGADRRPIWEIVDEINAGLPVERTYRPTARSILITISMERRSSSRESGICRHALLCGSLQSQRPVAGAGRRR